MPENGVAAETVDGGVVPENGVVAADGGEKSQLVPPLSSRYLCNIFSQSTIHKKIKPDIIFCLL